jgi:hypothetical protein
MSDSITLTLTLADAATAAMATAAGNISGSLTQIQASTGNLNGVYADAQSKVASINAEYGYLDENVKKTSTSFTQNISAANSMAQAGSNLYLVIDRIQTSQLALDLANLKVQRSAETLFTAQNAYNDAVIKYGETSPEALDKLTKMGIAQEALSVSTDRARLAADGYNNTLLTSSLTLIPSVVALFTGFSTVYSAIQASTTIAAAAQSVEDAALLAGVAPATGFSGAMAVLNAVLTANPIAIVVIAIAAIAAGLTAAYLTCEPFRNAINLIAGVLSGAFLTACNAVYTGFKALWDDVLVPLGAFLSAAFLTAINGAVTAWNALCGAANAVSDWWSGVSGTIGNGWAALTGAANDSKTAVNGVEASLNGVVVASNRVTAKLGPGGEGSTALKDYKNEVIFVDEAQIALNLTLFAANAAAEANRLKVQAMTADYTSLVGQLKAVVDKNNIELSPSLAAVATAFDTAMGEGRYTSAASYVQAFAAKFGLSINEAKGYIEGFKTSIDSVPTSINDQLVKTAQTNLETFKNCSTGKFSTIQTVNSTAWNAVVTDTNNLIKNGLVGQAQANIQAFVTCSTGKQTSMVETIKTAMTSLTTDYTAQFNNLTTMAGTATGNQKTAVLAQIDQLTTDYEAKMTALKTWLATLYSTMVADASSSTASISAQLTTMVAGGANIFDLINALRTGTFTPTAPTTPAAPAAPVFSQALHDQYVALDAAITTTRAEVTRLAVALAAHPGATVQTMYDTAAANYAAAFSAMGAFKEAHAVGTYGIGGIINREQLALLGEEGPEAVIPLEKMQFYMNKWIKPQGSGLTINGPLIVVQGNADERTAKLAADLVMNRVRRLVQT